MAENLDATTEESTEEVEVLDETKDSEEELEEEESSTSEETTEETEEAQTVPIARLNQVLEREREAREQLAAERAQNQRLLDSVLNKPTETHAAVDEYADIKAIGYDPDYMTDNEIRIAKNQAADRKILLEIRQKETDKETQSEAAKEVQVRYIAQLETLSECEDSPLTEAQKQEVIQVSLKIAKDHVGKTPEHLATISLSAWKKSRTKPTEKIKVDKTSVAEAPNRGSGPTRGSIPAGGNLKSNDDAIDAACKAMGYTGN